VVTNGPLVRGSRPERLRHEKTRFGHHLWRSLGDPRATSPGRTVSWLQQRRSAALYERAACHVLLPGCARRANFSESRMVSDCACPLPHLSRVQHCIAQSVSFPSSSAGAGPKLGDSWGEGYQMPFSFFTRANDVDLGDEHLRGAALATPPGQGMTPSSFSYLPGPENGALLPSMAVIPPT
jgi:hypothetical protein